jgi:hypothetical protein
VFETELLDSTTGKQLFIEVYKKKAKKVLKDGQQKVTLDTVRYIIDHAAEQTRLFFGQNTAK